MRAELSRARAAASPAEAWRARRWRMAPACAANAASSRWRPAGTTAPTRTSSWSSSASARGDPLSRRASRESRQRVGRGDDLGRVVVAGPPDHGGRIGPEHLDGAAEQERQLVGGPEQRVAEVREGRGLRLRPQRPVGPAGTAVDDPGDGRGDHDEDEQGDGVLGRRDGQPTGRRA